MDATSTEAANAAVTAAEAAFDSVADAEDGHRDAFQSSPSSPAAEAGAQNTSTAAGDDAQQPAFLATESVMQQRTYFGGVMVAYVFGLGAAFAVRHRTLSLLHLLLKPVDLKQRVLPCISCNCTICCA